MPAQNDDRIWSGVYTTAQAERGKAAFVKSCSNCHSSTLDGTVRAPALRGDRFMADWLNTNVYTLFTKLRDTMPATYPETVADDVKLDILTYLLQANSFPGGSTALKLDEKDLANIQIVKQGAREIPNFALVTVTGCLAPGPGSSWTLTNAGDPVATKEEVSTDPQSRTTRNPNLSPRKRDRIQPGIPSRPEDGSARSAVYRETKDSRINLTSLQMVAPDCP